MKLTKKQAEGLLEGIKTLQNLAYDQMSWEINENEGNLEVSVFGYATAGEYNALKKAFDGLGIECFGKLDKFGRYLLCC